MLTIKEYAAEHHITYEAVRKQIDRYSADLEGHIVKQGRTQYLDDEAVAFLDSKRAGNPVVVYQANKDEEIDRLSRENEALRTALIAAQQEAVQHLKELREQDKAMHLLEDAEVMKKRVAELEEDISRLGEERNAEKARADDEHLMAAEARLEASSAQERATAQERRAEDAEKARDEEKRRADEAEATIARLKGRSLWQRITRKGEE